MKIILVSLFIFSLPALASIKTKWVCHSGQEGYEVRIFDNNKAKLLTIDSNGKKIIQTYQLVESNNSATGELVTFAAENFLLRLNLEDYRAHLLANVEGELPIDEHMVCRK